MSSDQLAEFVEIPTQCCHVNTPWPLTLADAQDLFQRRVPELRYLRRMRIKTVGNSLENFITVVPQTTNGSSLTPEAHFAAIKRREEYVESDEFCEPCNKHVIFNAREASCVCMICGLSRNHNPTDHSFREGTSLHVPYLYKQSNHFRDHLKRIQAKESTDIPPEVMTAISAELDKLGDDRSNVTPEDIRLLLKSLGKSNLYNHVQRIYSMATGKQPPVMTSAQETELMMLFSMIQGVWGKIKPPSRNNFLSYQYILHKSCSLLGYQSLAKHFKLLKSRDKLRQQDVYWRKICQELDFEFQPSQM